MIEGAIIPSRHELSDKDFEKISSFIHKEAGIVLPAQKRAMIRSRLLKRLRALNLDSFSDYCALIDDPSKGDEHSNLIASLTTNVSHFFREKHHFDLLRASILPDAIKRARSGQDVRIWSAGCSNGQEVYSIAMTLLDLAPDAADLDIKFLATDLDKNVVAFARAGLYGTTALQGLDDDMLNRHFEKTADGYQIHQEVRQLVRFNTLNLLRDWPMKRSFDVIFCRNVVIYFDEETQLLLWPRFVNALKRNGYLCIGHSERIAGPSVEKMTSQGITAYQKH